MIGIRTPFLSAVIAALAACSGNGSSSDSTDTGEVDVPSPFSEVFALAESYEPVEKDGTSTAREVMTSDDSADGVTGFIAYEDGTIDAVRIRISADEQTLYLSRDGGEELAFDTRRRINGSGGRWERGRLRDSLTLRFEGQVIESNLGISGESDGLGFAALATSVEDLPAGSVTYEGSFSLRSRTVTPDGRFQINVDFVESTVDGALSGAWSRFRMSGNIEGAVDDGLIAAKVTSAPDDATPVELDMLGFIYDDGRGIGGVMAGSVAGSTVGGPFDGSLQD